MASLREKSLFLILSLSVVFTLWVMARFWLLSVAQVSPEIIHIADTAIVSAAAVAIIVLVVRWISRPLSTYVGPTQSNAVKLLFEVIGLALIPLIAFSITGFSVVSTLVGVGFFGIVIGLAAQSVLGNLLSGIMLLASRPFNINDRIALITWQYGKFPPTLPHGWLEPAYTGAVKGITLTYTKILTDSGAMLKIPNALVTQSLILNLSHGRTGHVGTQFELPISIDPDDAHKQLALRLSADKFTGEEQNFDLLEVSPTGYLVAVNYSVEKGRETKMKTALLRAIRAVLADSASKRELVAPQQKQ